MTQTTLFQNAEEAKPHKSFVQNGIDTRPRKWCVVHNDVVLARVDWSIHMNRIFTMLVSQIPMDADRFQPQRIQVKHLRELAGISTKNIHERLADAAQRLVREPIEFRTPDNHYDGYPIFTKCSYLRNEGAVRAVFNDPARPYLLELRKSFTKYRLQQAMQLSTSYAVRFYQIAKMIQRDKQTRTRVIKIPQFRKLFKLEDKYSRHSDLISRVVDPSVEEVNEQTKTQIEVTTIRQGDSTYGKPISLEWTVWPESIDNKENTAKPKRDEESGRLITQSQFDDWYSSLSKKRRNELWKEARQKVIDDGKNPEDPGFEGWVHMKLRAMTQPERK